jgi:glutamate dehydrogenase
MARDHADARENLMAAARQALADGQSTIPAGFVEDLYGRSAAEDLEAYPAPVLARIAASAWQHLLAPRQRGRHDIRLVDHDIEIDGRRRETTVVEVVNDNMPFLLDSTLAEIVDQGYEPRLVAHPILAVERDASGALKRLVGEATADVPAGTTRESLIQVHLDRIDDEADRKRLVDGLDHVYADVERAVLDFEPMRARVAEAIAAYRSDRLPLPSEEVDEAIRFLEWIAADNFTILGARDYRIAADVAADPVEGTGLGILRDPSVRVLRRGKELVVMTPEVRAFLAKPVALIIAKANVKSRVHRRAYLDYIGVKLFGAGGKLEGELRIVGLFTSNAYTGSTGVIPYLRLKVAQVLARAGFDPASYSGRALLHVLDTYPRDELFQVDVATLYGFALDVLQLTERPRVRALARLDEFDRFVSVLVYIPKDRYDTDVRRRVGDFLARVYQGRLSAAYPAYPEGPLARTHYIVGRTEGETPQIDGAMLESSILGIVRTWSDTLRGALEETVGGARARALAARYADGFSAAYREAFAADAAIKDIGILETLSDDRPRAVDIYRRDGEAATRASLKVFARGTPMPLSERVPLLENLGFRVVNERTYRVVPARSAETERVWLHDMMLERASGLPIDIERLGPDIEVALMALFRGLAESDRFNTLVLEADLGWRDAAVMRSLGRYLRQIRVPYGQDYLATTLSRYPAVAKRLVQLFYARFDPRGDNDGRDARQGMARAEIEGLLKDVTSLDDDRILRRFLNLVESAIRTNFFQVGLNGHPRDTIALKFECARIEGLPLPRPLYEIFVYSPRVEGVHLRFGKVARGGLRWSDRPQDFRTEILGLVKAQQVKNAVIVPVGAKGGFVPKRPPPPSDRTAWLNEGVETYKIFVGTLLDLTDNIVGDRIVPPASTVRHDGDDPYLVVAADKGTATFSDIANTLSEEHHHWLADAFASGGSQGYDHKKMGITARGAWEAVKRHFREMDIDIQSQSVTVAGVGDMSGDVFGNGMLLSRALKIVAAFDHRDIFLDPNPDPVTTFAERQRLFDLPRSSWQDYDTSLVSKGGGIYSRSLKSIPLMPEVRALLGLSRSEATPEELINAILKAPVDLLWFGGIGTYVRAVDETDDAVGDRANDAIRITGGELRCKVIGEGANLGATQKGRIEAAKAGVRLNTDAIDNSAGVNTSDVEVNIKIALSLPERDGRLDPAARNALLAEMTDEVGHLVLRNNYLQTLALSLTERRGTSEIGFARRLMQMLELQGRLDRQVEFLPDDIELAARERRGEALTRPELAVLLAYAKLALHDSLLDSAVPDEPYLARELVRYFPQQLIDRYPDAIQGHRLRREIIATQLANAIVNRGGTTVVTRLVDQSGADAATIASAYAVARDSYGLPDLNTAIDALDGRIGGAAQLSLYAELQEVLLGRLVWFIRNADFSAMSLERIISIYGGGITAIASSLGTALPDDTLEAINARVVLLEGEGVPPDLAKRLAALRALTEAPDIVLVAEATSRPVVDVAATHFALGGAFKLAALVQAGRDIAVADYYDRLALDRAIDGIASAHRRLTAEVVAGGGSGVDAVTAWSARRGPEVARIRGTVEGIAASGLTLSKLTVASSLLGDLARA